MCVADSSTMRGALREDRLPFEGFLEALCRAAALKALPTRAEVMAVAAKDSKVAKGGVNAYLAALDEEAQHQLIQERPTEWGEPPRMPIAESVGLMLELIAQRIGEDLGGKFEEPLPEIEAKRWVSSVGQQLDQ